MSGLFLLGLAGLFIWLAVSAALKGNAKNPLDALQHVSGFTVGVLLILALLIFGLPTLLEYMAKDALPKFWGPVLTDAWDDTQDAGSTVADMLNGRTGASRPDFFVENRGSVSTDVQPVMTNQPVVTNPQAKVVPVTVLSDPVVVQARISHTVVAGDTLRKIADQHSVTVDEIVSLNSIANRNAINVGDTFVIQEEIVVVPTAVPVIMEPTAVPVPTSTPIKDWSIEFDEIERAKTRGDIEGGVNAINAILRGESSNVVARAYQQEIQLAYDVIGEWESIMYGPAVSTTQAGLESALAGFEFRVKSMEDGFNITSKMEEAMVLECVSPNWLRGREVTISRYMGERLGFAEVGDTLRVGG